MSDIRFNRWLHQSGTGGVSQDSSGNIGIGTTVPTMALDVRGDVNIGNTININNASGIISATTFTGTTGTFSGNVSAVDGTFTGNVTIGGTLTYEDVANIDAVGIITAQSDILIGRNLNVTGVSTGTKFNSTTSPNYVISDGTTEKGYIGYNANDPFIGRKNGVGLAFQNNKVRPVDGDNGSPSSNTVDLGEPTYKFKDAYLTGTVNSAGINATGVATATTFSGNLTGNVTGDITGNIAGTSTIAGISSSISDTAVDVFVYDTRKDSDGGAWRKRTQHTSWYNETLNTATRGSRREFPAVAVIVTETTQVTIYDGDDPDLPMWMVFNSGSGNALNYPNGAAATATVMLNGKLANAAAGGSPRFRTIDFLSDSHLEYSHTDGRTTFNINVSQRNAGASTGFNYGNVPGAGLIHRDCNDVAMTVLPNAPIDDATGLPVPTIAVATDGGVSVIKDDGTVVDIRRTSDDDVHFVALDGDRVIMFMELGAIYVATIPSADQSGNPNSAWSVYGSYGGNTSGTDHPAIQAYGPGLDLVSMKDHTFATAGYNLSDKRYKGLSILSENVNSSGNGMVAWAHTDFNTGWMHGDIKGAFLSDTDTTNVTGSDLIDNGDFGTGDFTNWSTSGTTTPTISSGGALLTTGAADGAIWQSTSGEATSGKWVITWTVTSNSGGFFGLFLNNNGANGSGGSLVKDSITTSGSYYYEGSITAVEFRHRASSSGIIDNITLRRVEDDRSVNNKGLQVYGTVTKSAVATGAELVGYSGFQHTNPDNYLKQPYNSDLDFGTGDFSVTWWQYITGDIGSSQYVYDRQGGNGNRHAVYYTTANSGTLAFYTVAGSASEILATGINSYKDGWACYTVSRGSSGLMEIYVNGELKQSTTLTVRNLTNTSAELFIGIRHSLNTDGATQAKYALMRFSKSIPSPEQIKKIYNDEKHLFQENAKATLYGSSDAVTALAYDEDTELLHVGTSSGRSDFQGLRRINNTTTAVTTAISASDDLIAEQ